MPDNDIPAVPKPSDPVAQSAIGQITDVNAQTEAFVKQKYKKQLTLLAFAVVIFEGGIISYVVINQSFSGGGIWFMAVPLIVLYSFYKQIQKKVEDTFFQQFAAANSFTFQLSGLPSSLDGSIFLIGNGGFGRDLVSGTFQQLPLSLFNYQYEIGSGKNHKTYVLTIMRLDYPTPVPPIFLQVAGHNFGEGIFSHFSQADSERVQLEGDFSKYFTLSTRKGFETEALEVFTPDFMAKIQAEWKIFSLEFINSHIYIYCVHEVTKKPELDEMYALAQYLISKIAPLAQRMKSSLVSMEQTYDKK